MPGLEAQLQDVTVLTPLAVTLVALAGLVVGIAPSSFPLLSVGAGLATGIGSGAPRRGIDGARLALGFVLGIATVDAVVGALFGVAGFAVMHVLARLLAPAYGLLGALLIVAGLALLRVIRVVIPVLAPSSKPARSFFGSYALGLPFGLSTCPACTPLLLPVVAAAAATADPVLGAILMFIFGIARGIPIVIAGALAGALVDARRTRVFVRWVERVAGVLMLAAGAYLLYLAAVYAGLIPP